MSSFRAACENNNLNVAIWLDNLFHFTRREVLQINTDKYINQIIKTGAQEYNSCFRYVCAKGHHDVAKWIHNKWTQTAKDITTCGNSAFFLACENGHYDIVVWLYELCDKNIHEAHKILNGIKYWTNPEYSDKIIIINNSKDAILYNYNNLFRIVCGNSHNKIAYWLDNEFKFTREELMIVQNQAFMLSCENANIELAKWLHSKCNFTKEEITTSLQYVKKLNVDIAAWLNETFNLNY